MTAPQSPDAPRSQDTPRPRASCQRGRLGEGCYTTLLVPVRVGLDQRPLSPRLQDCPSAPLHIGRLCADAVAMGLPPPTFRAITAALEEAFERLPTSTLPSSTPPGSLPGIQPRTATPPPPDAMWRLRLDCIAASPLDIRLPADAVAVEGQLQLLGERARPPARLLVGPPLRDAGDPFCGSKRIGVAAEFAILRAAQTNGYDEVMLCDRQGRASEAITSAIWFGRDGVVWTPAAASGPLRSSTTALVRALAAVDGWSFQDTLVDATSLMTADWIVLANAVAGARPVASLNGVALPPPPGWLVAATRAVVDGGDAAARAMAALQAGHGPAWAVAAVGVGVSGVADLAPAAIATGGAPRRREDGQNPPATSVQPSNSTAVPGD